MKKAITIALFFFLVSCASHKSNVQYDTAPYYTLKINQKVLPYSIDYSFVAKNECLMIFELKTKKHSSTNQKNILKKRLTKEEMLDIVSALKKMEHLESHYTDDKWIDGIYWEIEYSLGDSSRKIAVGNMGVEEITTLFETINKCIPDDKPTLVIWESLGL